MCPATAGLPNTATHHQHVDDTAIVHIHVEPVVHRGPDDAGDMAKTTNDYAIGMAMRRLSIIDLTTGNQPFFSDKVSQVAFPNKKNKSY